MEDSPGVFSFLPSRHDILLLFPMYSRVACVKLHMVGFCTECVRDKFSGVTSERVFCSLSVCSH